MHDWCGYKLCFKATSDAFDHKTGKLLFCLNYMLQVTVTKPV